MSTFASEIRYIAEMANQKVEDDIKQLLGGGAGGQDT